MLTTVPFLSSAIASLIATAAPSTEIIPFDRPSCASPAHPCLTQVSSQTHANPAYGFQFEYPAGFAIETESEQLIETQSHVQIYTSEDYRALQQGTLYEPGRFIEVSAYENPDRLSAQEWSVQNSPQSNLDPARPNDVDAIRVAGQAAIAFSWCGMFCGDSVVFTNGDRNVVVVVAIIDAAPADPVRAAFEQILNTFQFVDSDA